MVPLTLGHLLLVSTYLNNKFSLQFSQSEKKERFIILTDFTTHASVFKETQRYVTAHNLPHTKGNRLNSLLIKSRAFFSV